jgi:hypothetical protein
MILGEKMFSRAAIRRSIVEISIVGLSVLGLAIALIARAQHSHHSEAPVPQPAATPALPSAAAGPVDLSRSEPLILADHYGKLPLSFEPNRGQTAAPVKFLSRGPGYTLFLTADEAVLKLGSSSTADVARTAPDRRAAVSPAIVRMKLVGANPDPQVTALDELPGKSNYFIGNNPKRWRTNVPNFSKVRYRKIYPGIDLVYYGNPRQLEYDFVVASGVDPRSITLNVTSDDATGGKPDDLARRATPLRIAADGDLLISANAREIRFQKPVVYQPGAARPQGTNLARSFATTKHFIDGRWVLKNSHQVGFEVAAYDRSKTLVIDPAVLYCTYLGGSSDNSAYNVVADANGNAYVAGNTTSVDFPTVKPFQAANAGGSDVFVAKLNPSGTALIYSTYLGGTGQDYAYWINVDSKNQAHVTGSTSSPDFPVTAGVFQSTCGGECGSGTRNAYLTVLDSIGSALVYSTYLGGSGQDQANAIETDSTGNTYIAGWTTSTDFPTTTGAYQTTYSGTSDAFVSKINPTGTALIYSTLLGVSDDNRAFGIQFDKSGDSYITGYTTSTGFPTTTGAFQTTLKGSSNAFITEVNPTATGLVYSTYLGGSGTDVGWAIALDSSNNTYISGQTTSTDFPTTTGALRTTCSSACSTNDAFVAKMDSTGKALVYSTYLGGPNGEQEAYALTINASGYAYATGRTESTDFPVSKGAFFTSNQGVYDAFIAELNPAGSALAYATYFGGDATDTGLGIALDSKANIYMVGRTYSPDLPVTPGTIQPGFIGDTQAFIVKFVTGDQVWPLALNYGTLTVGTTSAAQTATLTNSGSASLVLTGVHLTGTDADDYSITSNNCGAKLAPGASCSVSITFAPSASGLRDAALTITDGVKNSPQTVALSGTGSNGALSLTPATLTYATQVIGTTSPTQPATLTNIGTTIVGITNVSTSTQYTQTNNCPSSLAPSAFCTINVAFQPTASGPQTGALTVTNNTTGPSTTALSGVGTVISFSPASVNFGDQTERTSSKPVAVTVKNVGAAAVTITKIGITGGHISAFSETNNCPISPSTFAGGASCTVNVVFTPNTKGAVAANLSVLDSGGGSPQSVPLSGTGD